MKIVLDSPSLWGIIGTSTGVILQYTLSLITSFLGKGKINIVSLDRNELSLEKMIDSPYGEECSRASDINDYDILRLNFECRVYWSGKNPWGIKNLVIRFHNKKVYGFKKTSFIEIPTTNIVYVAPSGQRCANCPSVPLYSFFTVQIEIYDFAIKKSSPDHVDCFAGDFIQKIAPRMYAVDIDGKQWLLGDVLWKVAKS